MLWDLITFSVLIFTWSNCFRKLIWSMGHYSFWISHIKIMWISWMENVWMHFVDYIFAKFTKYPFFLVFHRLFFFVIPRWWKEFSHLAIFLDSLRIQYCEFRQSWFFIYFMGIEFRRIHDFIAGFNAMQIWPGEN